MRQPHSRRSIRRALIVILALAFVAAACATDATTLVRSDPATIGLSSASDYTIRSSPNGSAEKNQICTRGLNEESPVVALCTSFGRAGSLETQDVEVTLPGGQEAIMLGMSRVEVNFGLTKFLVADISTFRMNQADGPSQCALEVRMKLTQNFIQLVSTDANDFDGIWYYDVECTPEGGIDLDSCSLHGLVITEIWQTRLTGKSLFINQGHSVTLHDGILNTLPCGWWTYNDRQDTEADLLGAADLISDLVHDLGASGNSWLELTPGGRFDGTWVSYSAGDADTYVSFDRVFLNRQNDYTVHQRSEPGGPVRSLVIRPTYNLEWNDFSQNWEAFKGYNPLSKIEEKIDDSGYPKDPNDDVLKEIETVGCQNCPNPSLEQIQILDPATDELLYAMTIRGYIGSEQSLVMWGPVKPPSIDRLHSETATPRGECDVERLYDEEGKVSEEKSLSTTECAYFLREGAIWRHLTEDPDDFGFDLVGRFQIEDNSLWRTICNGSGESTHCFSRAIEQKLDASYLFNTVDTEVPWTVMQVLGEVGVRVLGLSYAYEQFAGNGLLFAMEQNMMRQVYFGGSDNPELIWALDSRALQLPFTMASAFDTLYQES